LINTLAAAIAIADRGKWGLSKQTEDFSHSKQSTASSTFFFLNIKRGYPAILILD
jgi:hypothetical protein